MTPSQSHFSSATRAPGRLQDASLVKGHFNLSGVGRRSDASSQNEYQDCFVRSDLVQHSHGSTVEQLPDQVNHNSAGESC